MRLAVSRFFEVRGQPIEALGKLEQFSADFREPRLAHNMPDFLRGPTVVSGPALLVFGHRAICPRDTKRQPGPQVPSAQRHRLGCIAVFRRCVAAGPQYSAELGRP